MEIGSEAHKELFCRTFFEVHRPYEPAALPWPALDEEALALLRGIPFWTHALQAEEDAGPMITACADHERDPLVREALLLQAYEETRHARLIRHMIALYALPAGDIHVEVPPDAVEAFIDFGFEECLDSFGAFGLFKLAREHMLVPDPLFEIFDQVMQEEANHIVFFINWFNHRQARRRGAARWLRRPRAGWHYWKALRKLYGLVRDEDAPEGKDFVVTGAGAFVDNLTPRLVVEACVSENERRLARFDRRLLVPGLVPGLARIALGALRLVPARSPGGARGDAERGHPRPPTTIPRRPDASGGRPDAGDGLGPPPSG
jgi:hypothetical protein